MSRCPHLAQKIGDTTLGVCVGGAHEHDLIQPQAAFQLKRSGNKPLQVGWGVPALHQSLLYPVGDGVSARHQRRAARAWVPHTSNMSPWAGSCLGSTVSIENKKTKQTNNKKGRLNSKNIICQKKDLCSQKATLYPKSLPQNSYWSLAFRIS